MTDNFQETLPPLKLGGLYQVKGFFNKGIISPYIITDYWTARKNDFLFYREERMTIGSYIMIVAWKVVETEYDYMPKYCYQIDILYNEYVYREQRLHLDEWTDRFKEISV